MIERTRGGGSLGPGVVLWGMEDIGGRILWFMGEVSWGPGGWLFICSFFALVMGYLVVYCVFSVSFLVWLFRSVLVSPVFSFVPFSFPFISLHSSVLISFRSLYNPRINRSVGRLVGRYSTIRYKLEFNVFIHAEF